MELWHCNNRRTHMVDNLKTAQLSIIINRHLNKIANSNFGANCVKMFVKKKIFLLHI